MNVRRANRDGAPGDTRLPSLPTPAEVIRFRAEELM